ncbi:hypothetical protein ACFFX0_30430 [Citricoccus parietis]|uniref:Uncharacterized protein n=1 Tax=Citricoccus parietis TaxID=592307 RepID=A0ABV5G8J5_9MICC
MPWTTSWPRRRQGPPACRTPNPRAGTGRPTRCSGSSSGSRIAGPVAEGGPGQPGLPSAFREFPLRITSM